MSGNFTFQPDEAGMFGPYVSVLLNFIKFLAPVLSGKCQGIVREFWSVLNVTLKYAALLTRGPIKGGVPNLPTNGFSSTFSLICTRLSNYKKYFVF